MKRRSGTAARLLVAVSGAVIWGCPVAPDGDGACANENEACLSGADCCEGLECVEGVCVSPGGGAKAALPAKNIEFSLICIHDPASDGYNDDCISCHGDRTDEMALDGATPSAHATMMSQFGEGNDRCIRCHESGPDFLTASGGGLRAQVDIVGANCVVCHSAQATLAFYAE